MISSKTIKRMAGASLAAATLSTAAIVPAVFARPHNPTVLAAYRSGDRDPRLHAALRELEAAQTALQNADRDSAGHREKALDLVQRAIEETHKAIRHDR